MAMSRPELHVDGRRPDTRGGSIYRLDHDTVAVRHGASIFLFRPDEIIAVRSAGNYTTIVSTGGELRVRSPMSEVVRTLSAFGVVRICRRSAVNLARVRQLVGRGGHKLAIVLDDGTEMSVGRSFQREIRARFGNLSRWFSGRRHGVGMEK